MHLVPNPDAPPMASPLRSLYYSRPTTRHLSHSYIYNGPELLHVGDLVRLTTTVELPPEVAGEVLDISPLQLPTSLVLHVTGFLRGGEDCPTVVRGKVYEMNEVGLSEVIEDEVEEELVLLDDEPEPKPATAPAPAEPVEGEDGTAKPAAAADADDAPATPIVPSATVPTSDVPAPKPKRQPPPRVRLPRAFPAHRWRCLTPGREIDVLLEDVAGRYYPCGPELLSNDLLVDEIHENGLRMGVVGQAGIPAMGLLLSGLMSGTRIPRVIVSNRHLI